MFINILVIIITVNINMVVIINFDPFDTILYPFIDLFQFDLIQCPSEDI